MCTPPVLVADELFFSKLHSLSGSLIISGAIAFERATHKNYIKGSVGPVCKSFVTLNPRISAGVLISNLEEDGDAYLRGALNRGALIYFFPNLGLT